MSAALNGLGRELFGLLGQLSVELAVLAVFVLLVGRVLRIKSPALRHFLWVAVLLKPIVAVTVNSPWTVFSPLISSGKPGWLAVPWALNVEDPYAIVASSPTIDGSTSPLTLAGWVAALWVLGSALLMGRILIGYGVIWRLRRQARVHRAGPLFGALQKARLALDVTHGADAATSRSIRSPIVLGILRPLIVVPAGFLERLRPDELAMVLMHELAHIRRCDNLALLIQRWMAVVLFFHPAVWLCGRRLRREAEQACDDLVIWATGRSGEYARGLTSVAELSHLRTHLKRRIPIMNVFSAAESDLALRIRRALGGGTHRMGTLSRMLTAILLCGVCGVTLPSTGISQRSDDSTHDARTRTAREKRDGVDWRAAMATDPEEWSEELKAQIVAAGYDLQEVAQKIRERRVWRAAMATAPEDWSEELKAQILALKPGGTLEEIAEGIRKRQQAASDLDGIARRIRAAVERGELTPEEGREKMAAAREAAGERGGDRLREFQRGVVGRAMATAPEEWSDELKAAIVRAGWDLDEFIEGIRQRQQAARTKRDQDDGVDWETVKTTPPERWSEQLKAQIVAAGYDVEALAERVRQGQATARDEAASNLDAIGRRIRAAVERGELTPEEGREKMAAARERLAAVASEKTSDLDDMGRRIRAAVERGELTLEEGRERMAAVRKRMEAASGERGRDDGVDWDAAMATSPDEWSDDLEAQIVAAGYDLEAVAERIRRAQEEEATRDRRRGEGFALNASTPNPFNPQTTIRYAIPEARDVQIVIYNLTGQKVRTLLAGRMEAGSHQLVWDGRDESGRQVASGTYLVDMKAGRFHQTLKVTLAK